MSNEFPIGWRPLKRIYSFLEYSEHTDLGNDNLNAMTSDQQYELRVDLTSFDGDSRYAEYDNFSVASSNEYFKLRSLGTYSGTAGMSTYFIDIMEL